MVSSSRRAETAELTLYSSNAQALTSPTIRKPS
jgi:hypothetical protein